MIGRTIEQSVIAFISDLARQKGATIIVGEFIPTSKNQSAENVYKELNFRDTGNNKFILDIKQQHIKYSLYIEHKIKCLSC